MSLHEVKFDWSQPEGGKMAQGPPNNTLRAVIPIMDSPSSDHPYPLMFDDVPVIRSGGNSPERTVIIEGEEFKLTPIKGGNGERPVSAGLTDADRNRQADSGSSKEEGHLHLDTHHHLHKHADKEKRRPQSANNQGIAMKKAAAKKRAQDVGYKSTNRSRSERRIAEWLEEKAAREAKERALRRPPRLNAEGVPMYMTVSAHKANWEKQVKEEQEKVAKHQEHCRRIGQDRESLCRVVGTDGKSYVYDYRGFRVEEHVHEEAEAKKRKEEEAEVLKETLNSKEAKIRRAAQAKPFTGEILNKTHRHVQNMRRLVKFRYEHAMWDVNALPSTTYKMSDPVTTATKMLTGTTSQSIEQLLVEAGADDDDDDDDDNDSRAARRSTKSRRGHRGGGGRDALRRSSSSSREGIRDRSKGRLTGTSATLSPSKAEGGLEYEEPTVLGASAAQEHRDFLKYGNRLGNSSSKFDKSLGGTSSRSNFGKAATDMHVNILPESCFVDGPEFANLEPADVIIKIEHCFNCRCHSYKSRHDEAQYVRLAQEYKAILSGLCAQYAVRCYVYVVPIEDHDPYNDQHARRFHHSQDYSDIIDGVPGKSGGNTHTWSMLDVLEKVKLETRTNRQGAFEIQVGVMNHGGERAKHILHSKLYSGMWPMKGKITSILSALLEQYFGHYASLRDGSAGVVPLDLYEDKLADKEAIFIFDGTMLGSSQFHAIVAAYRDAKESVEKFQEEKKRRKQMATGMTEENANIAVEEREREEEERKKTLNAERTAALIEQLKAVKEASEKRLKDISESENAERSREEHEVSRERFSTMMLLSSKSLVGGRGSPEDKGLSGTAPPDSAPPGSSSVSPVPDAETKANKEEQIAAASVEAAEASSVDLAALRASLTEEIKASLEKDLRAKMLKEEEENIAKERSKIEAALRADEEKRLLEERAKIEKALRMEEEKKLEEERQKIELQVREAISKEIAQEKAQLEQELAASTKKHDEAVATVKQSAKRERGDSKRRSRNNSLESLGAIQERAAEKAMVALASPSPAVSDPLLSSSGPGAPSPDALAANLMANIEVAPSSGITPSSPVSSIAALQEGRDVESVSLAQIEKEKEEARDRLAKRREERRRRAEMRESEKSSPPSSTVVATVGDGNDGNDDVDIDRNGEAPTVLGQDTTGLESGVHSEVVTLPTHEELHARLQEHMAELEDEDDGDDDNDSPQIGKVIEKDDHHAWLDVHMGVTEAALPTNEDVLSDPATAAPAPGVREGEVAGDDRDYQDDFDN